MRGDALDFDVDAELIAALRHGDEEAFIWLVDRYCGPLRRLARSFVPSDAVADEVVQEAWLGIIRGIDGFEGRCSLKTWLYQIVLNIARTKGAREARTVPFASAGADGRRDGDDHFGEFDPDHFLSQRHSRGRGHWGTPPEPSEPADRLDRRETLERVHSVIGMLPPSQRAVISLRDIDGWTSDEVCTVLSITPTNQRVLLHRARARVRNHLDLYLHATAV